MFDAIAPRYDLVNRIMTFRHGRRLARAHRRAPCDCRSGRVLDLACGTGDLCRELERAYDSDRSASTSRSACWPPARTEAPLVPGRRPAAAGARAARRRGHVRLRPAQLRRPRRLLRRAGRVVTARRTHRAARGGRAAEPRPAAGATASTSARSCPGSAACCRTARLPLPAEVGGLPAASPTRCSTCSRERGFRDVERRLLSGGIAQLHRRPPARPESRHERHCAPCTRRLDADVDLLAVAGDDGVLWTARTGGFAGRGEA